MVSTYPAIQEQGLYYIQDLHFVPADTDSTRHIATLSVDTMDVDCSTAITGDDDTTVRTGSTQLCDHVDFEQPLHIDNKLMQLRKSQETKNPICTTVNYSIADPRVYHIIARMGIRNSMEADVLHFETWHQLMAH